MSEPVPIKVRRDAVGIVHFLKRVRFTDEDETKARGGMRKPFCVLSVRTLQAYDSGRVSLS